MGLFTKTNPTAGGSAVATPQDSANGKPAPAPAVPLPSRNEVRPVAMGERQLYMQQLKVRIHQQLVERLDVQNLRSLPPDTVRSEVRVLIRELCQSEKGLLSHGDQERLM